MTNSIAAAELLKKEENNMKKLIILTLSLISLSLASCDMGTPAPSGIQSNRDKKIIELSERGEYFKVLTVRFDDNSYLFVPLRRDNLKDWTATVNDKKIRVNSNSPDEIAAELFGKTVKEARWSK